MKTIIVLIMLSLLWVNLVAQDITISFEPKVSGNSIDSIWVTNQRTSEKVKLLESESLLLDVSTEIDFIQKNEEEGTLYPNPGYGDATLVFSTSKDQNVMISVYNISGQVLGVKRQELSPGLHQFSVKFPVIGLYVVSVRTDDGQRSLKAVVMGIKMQEFSIDYAGSESLKLSKNAMAGKKMDYKVGDILHYSVNSGKNNTIVTDSPVAVKVYAVEFFECKDQDNQYYPVVKIGNQWWMAKNLAWLPSVSPRSVGSTTAPYYYVYDYSGTDASAAKNNSNYSTYGVLYNWPAALTACPAGWHLPCDAEWTILTTHLGGGSVAGGKMKETGTTHWYDPNEGATNESGFSALPDGYRNDNCTFSYIGYHGYWWSSTEYSITDAWNRYVLFYLTTVYRYNYYKESGFSVRCVRDDVSLPTVSTAIPDSITSNSVILGGDVTSQGGVLVSERGICYDTILNPTTANTKKVIGSGLGKFKAKITGLTEKTKYYARAYAINSLGIAYGDQKTFTTKSSIPDPGKLEIAGSLTLSLEVDPKVESCYHALKFNGYFELINNTQQTGSITKQIHLFTSPGGYSILAGKQIWWTGITNPGQRWYAGPFGWIWTASLTHVIVRTDGTIGGNPIHAVGAVPLLAKGFMAPGDVDFSNDLHVGVIGPLNVFKLTNGKRWLDFTGSIVDMTNSDSSRPSLRGEVRDGSGNIVVELSTNVGHPADLPPVYQFRAWAEIPVSANPLEVRVTANQNIAGRDVIQTASFPLDTATTRITIRSPVSGTWAWANGPGLTRDWHAHFRSPEARYGYDLAIEREVNGWWQSFSGNPAVNESYFCWGSPIYAVMKGTVVYVNDTYKSNNGNQADVLGNNNEIVIEHAGGVYSRYAHMQKGSAMVSLGQVIDEGTQIATVGNAGASSEPHLHFHMYRIDETGRFRAVAFMVEGMKNELGTPVSGVPASHARWVTENK